MSFHLSAQNVRVEEGHILRATLTNAAGAPVDAEFDLDTVLGNDNGSFQWDAVDFSKSAEEVSFSLEGDESVPILRARLLDVDGNAVSRDVNLSERISNADGQFLFLE